MPYIDSVTSLENWIAYYLKSSIVRSFLRFGKFELILIDGEFPAICEIFDNL